MSTLTARTTARAAVLALIGGVLAVLLMACGTTLAGPGTSVENETIDPVSGLPWIDEATLPAEAHETLDLIDRGGPYPFRQDDSVFGNREGLLPKESRGYYHEYTVVTPTETDRGARRIVTGSEGEFYWTADHYASFSRIRSTR